MDDSKYSHEQLRELLPWYVNDTLGKTDRDLVAMHLYGCPTCRDDFKVLNAAQRALQVNDVEAIVPATTAAELLGTRFGHTLRSKRDKSRNILLLAAAASLVAIVLVLQINSRPATTENQLFETAASGGVTSQIDYVLRIEFADNLAAEQRQQIVGDLDGVAGWSVDDADGYVVQLQVNNPSLAALEEIERKVRLIQGVQSANFVAMQVPVR